MTVAAIVLASTSPGVLGMPRHLAIEDGMPIVRVITAAATTSSVDAVAVVTGGPHADRIARAIAGLDFVELPNPRWIEGAASSIRAGVAWADAQGFDAVIVVPGDRNRASADHLDALVRQHRRGHALVATRHCDVLGVPACFARPLFRDLMALLGDRGAGDVIAAADDPGVVDWEDEAPKRSSIRALRTTRPRARVGRS